ncbi:cytochrome c biogenesis factor [gamma proteobacterium HIMB55]|nr:cytochrome c biogenesis factor [gamma proteobacterium HIMB55]
MTELWPIVTAFCALAALFVVGLPMIWRRKLEGETVDDWLAVRRTETSDELLLSDAQLRVWDDKETENSAQAKADSITSASSRPGYQVALAGLIVLATIVLYDRLGAYEDVQITRSIASLDEATPTDVTALIARIEARSVERPGNLDYQSLLGEYYVATGNAAGALERFEAILAEAPNAPDVLGRAAQAEFVAEGQVLTERARKRAEQALAGDPRQKSALATLAMGSFGAERYQEAIGYMRVLRDLEIPGSEGHQLMISAIAEAESRLSSAGATEVVSETTAAEATKAAVTVTVSLPVGVDESALAGQTVFVIARPAGSAARMPTAVTRIPANSWPLTVSLSDANSMAGQKLSALAKVDLEVQVSPSGQPGLNNASFTGALRGVLVDSNSVAKVTIRAISQ